ncbi:HNH endonuclease [Phyllobacterium sp. YR531]|uniref:HNH endonuclease n=1 Tax=Phyllobacterium sp. YR531 TaxID=1144343 RepID=UPI0012F62797|nr:HNH endonuclease [Phyllobacterium sp. YR531]
MPAIFQIKSNEANSTSLHEVFYFENKYLPLVKAAMNDWIIYYHPARRAGDRHRRTAGYFATARVVAIESASGSNSHSVARLTEFCEFPSVPFSIASPSATARFYYEQNMQESDGSLNRHANQQRVRLLSVDEYNAIMAAAFGSIDDVPKVDPSPYVGFAEDPPELLFRSRFVTSRALRDRTFSKAVGEAYEWKCAMTGIALAAFDGSHEIECAHIKPVKDSGPDSVRNGIPLLRTFHWLFDKGFISIDWDYRIISSSRYNHTKLDLLINRSGRIILPKNELEHPHPDFLHYHREYIFQP